jgi:nucleoside-diphosphate-sugar epimerase
MSEEDSKVEKKRISILGCGWLGFPLAKRLQEVGITSGIKGSTTSASKLDAFSNAGIEGYLMDLRPETGLYGDTANAFFDTDVVVIAVPPRMSKNEPGTYPAQMQMVADAIRNSPVKEIIFVSSTGIYPDLNRIMEESDVDMPEKSALPDMVTAEDIIASLRPDRTVAILRMSGLLGYNRIPGKYVRGKKEMETGNIPVNYIHRDDAVGVIIAVLEQGVVNDTFNIVTPLHPVRRDVYERSCATFGWEAPTFREPETMPDYKVISGDKFEKMYHYNFKYPDPLNFHYRLEDVF